MPDEGFTELAGERVLLRRFQPADVAEFVAYRSCVEVARFQSWDAPYPRATGQLIGDCAARPHADDPRQCEIGFTIAPGHQGRGYATEATRLLVGYLFGRRAKHRITASCDARNAASAAVLERLGMRREGHLRESSWAKGEWTDDLLYGLLHHEWQRGRPAG
jgi:aminoglycoside 6'-N-acetyltransferase